jgi:hypothetical protein
MRHERHRLRHLAEQERGIRRLSRGRLQVLVGLILGPIRRKNETLIVSFITKNVRTISLHLPEIDAKTSLNLSRNDRSSARLYLESEYSPVFWCSVDQKLDVSPLAISDSLSQNFMSKNGISLGIGFDFAHPYFEFDIGVGATALGIDYVYLTDLGRIQRNAGIYDLAFKASAVIRPVRPGFGEEPHPGSEGRGDSGGIPIQHDHGCRWHGEGTALL